MEQFNYCIARYWGNEDNALCVYAYGSEVSHGSMQDAEWLLAYVKSQCPDEDYFICKVEPLGSNT